MRDEICVVGAGGSGLAAGYALRRRGLAFRILEARDGIGGMWRHGQTFAYDSLTSNTSRYRTSFRAHRITRRGPAFIHHTEFLAYLESFADRFGLRDHVEPGARVVRAEPRDGGWEVQVDGREPEAFRALVVCTGVLGRARPVEYEGDFDGPTLHSGEYRSSAPFAGKDVVIAGVGASGAEIAGELADVARSVTLAVRTPLWLAPKHIAPRVPFDIFDTRLGARLLPFALRRSFVDVNLRLVMRRGASRGMPVPQHRVLDRPVAMSDSFLRALRRGRFDVRPAIRRLDGRTVHFDDGSARDADAVIFAIGYDPSLDFLPRELVDGWCEHHAPLLRGVAHPEADGLFFIGIAVGQGALLPVFEAQALWAAAVIAGDLPWPAPDERRRQLAEEARRLEREFGRPHTVWRDRLRYVIELEREVGRATRRASRARFA